MLLLVMLLYSILIIHWIINPDICKFVVTIYVTVIFYWNANNLRNRNKKEVTGAYLRKKPMLGEGGGGHFIINTYTLTRSLSSLVVLFLQP